MSSWRLAGRLAVRQARRRPARTALVVGLIGLPVAGVVVASTVARTTAIRAEQTGRWQTGTADAVVSVHAVAGQPDPVAATEAVVAALPAGSRALVTHFASELVRRHDGGFAEVGISDLPLADPLAAGVRLLRSGRAPAGPGEAAVSPAVLRAARAGVGDTITLARAGSAVRITGTVVNPAELDARIAVVTAGIDARSPAAVTSVYVDFPPGTPHHIPVLRNGPRLPMGGSIRPLSYGRDPEPEHLPLIRLFGGVALAVAAIVAAAAFAVSNRRHLRDLGLLSAAGARPNHLVRIMAVEGIVLGVAGAAAGVAVGLLGVAALAPHLDRLANHVTGGPRVAVGDLAAVAGPAVVAAALAAWTSARTAYWLPTLAALAGRRPLGRVPRYVPLTGLGLAGAGIGLIAWVGALDFGGDLWWFSLAGAVAVVLGATALSPWAVSGLEPLSRRLRGTPRLALRSLARQRIRSAAVVAAVMAAGALTVGGSTVLLGGDAQAAADSFPTPRDQVLLTATRYDEATRSTKWVVIPETVDAAVRALPGAVQAVRTRLLTPPSPDASGRARFSPVWLRLPAGQSWWPSRPGEGPPLSELHTLWADGPGLFDALGAPSGTDRALAAADAVTFAPTAAGAPVQATLLVGRDALGTLSLAVVRTERADLWGNVVVAPATVARLGLLAGPADTVVRAPRPLTAGQRRHLDDLSLSLGRRGDLNADVWFSFHRPAPSSRALRTLAVAAALAFTLAVVALGLALVAAESRQEQALLRALGARPRAARRTRVVQALTLAGLGGGLAVPVGFGATAAYLAGPDTRPVHFPTGTAIAVAVAIPLAVALATALAARVTGARPLGAALLSEES